jgi:futalosine hydrolase
MRILIVAATGGEVAPLVGTLARVDSPSAWLECYRHGPRVIDVLTTGVGMVATAAWTSRALAQSAYDVAFNFGLCGSFDRSLSLATVVHIVTDRIAELGAEDDAAFLTLEDLELPGEHVFVNEAPPANAALASLRRAASITVNTVHGNERSIEAVVERFHPDVESMEGAAFMYTCLMHRVPFAQVRAVSNIVERRNREAWNIAEAIGALCRQATEILQNV